MDFVALEVVGDFVHEIVSLISYHRINRAGPEVGRVVESNHRGHRDLVDGAKTFLRLLVDTQCITRYVKVIGGEN